MGMGRDFREAHAWARDIFDLADEVTGKAVSRLCFDGPMEELTRTDNLQPSITAVNLICHQALVDRGITPDLTAGHSLGEFSALAAAGVLTVSDTLRLTHVRGQLMHRAAEKRPGAMQAVMGLEIRDVEAITELARGRGVVVVANHNTPQQVVITGEAEAVAAAVYFVKEKGGKSVPLKVSGAWHSPLMDGAAEEFAGHLEKTDFMAPDCPVVLNVTGEAETDPDRIKKTMVRQITSPVRWCGSVESMLREGVTRFVEVGPKKVLSGLVKKIVPSGTEATILNVENLDGVDQAANHFGS